MTTKTSVHPGRFLAGAAPDHRGRMLADILAWPDATLEAVHDYIQWLFPLRTPSQAIPAAPVLDAAQAAAIRADPAARAGLHAAAERMIRFYANTADWLAPIDHNHLRITRMLTAMSDLAGPAAADALHGRLTALADRRNGRINAASRAYWQAAIDASVNDFHPDQT